MIITQSGSKLWAIAKGYGVMNQYDQHLRDFNENDLIKQFNTMNLDDQYEFLQNLAETSLNQKVKYLLIQLASHKHNYIRNEAIQILATYPSDFEVNQTLIAALQDTEELVRVNAAEIIGERNIDSGVSILIKMLDDKSPLVRGTTAISLSQTKSRKGEVAIRKRVRRERNQWVKLNLITALYILGDRQKFSKIIRYLNHKSYRIRCASANILCSIATEENKKDIITSLENALEVEKTVAVESSIRGALEELMLD